MPSVPAPAGEYPCYVFRQKGGGIRTLSPPAAPGSTPDVHVADAQAAFDHALREGAEVGDGGVTVAVVRAPRGVTIAVSGPKST